MPLSASGMNKPAWNGKGAKSTPSHSWLSAEEREPRSFSLPSDIQPSTMEGYPMGVGIPLCKGLSLSSSTQPSQGTRAKPEVLSSSPGCSTQHPLVKTPSARLSLPGFKWSKQEAAQENKHQMEWRSRVRKKKRKAPWSAQTPQILFEEMG